MKNLINIFFFFLIFTVAAQEEVYIIADQSSPRIKFGSERLAKVLEEAGYKVKLSEENSKEFGKTDRVIFIKENKNAKEFENNGNSDLEKKKSHSEENFRINSE